MEGFSEPCRLIPFPSGGLAIDPTDRYRGIERDRTFQSIRSAAPTLPAPWPPDRIPIQEKLFSFFLFIFSFFSFLKKYHLGTERNYFIVSLRLFRRRRDGCEGRG